MLHQGEDDVIPNYLRRVYLLTEVTALSIPICTMLHHWENDEILPEESVLFHGGNSLVYPVCTMLHQGKERKKERKMVYFLNTA
jgi:hypothetical protein